ncbi:unnamed protein product [Larinioides sclopetarius]|uniref:Centrosomal protein of 192 kDa n=1 Tax=Larinioides sclopetarius TaxID=280406 RepID=A0AAV1ZQU6_9ARAC
MEESKGFLDDTSLSKTPRSPLKTSTVLRPNSNRSEDLMAKRLAACGIDASFNPQEETTYQTLTEITNIPNYSLLKQRFKSVSEMSFADDANSSLGLLHMDNFSDIADMSLPASSFIQNEHQRNGQEHKLYENSKFLSLKVKETASVNFQDIEEDNEESDRNSSPDIEYDGTNIPELNLDYDARSAFQYPTSEEFKTKEGEKFKTKEGEETKAKEGEEFMTKEDEESFYRNFEAIQNDSSYNFIERSLQISNTQASNNESKMVRESLFENFNPAYDSIYKSLMPNASVSDDDKVSRFSQVRNACSFINGNSSEVQAIIQNQTLAEQNFLKNLQKLSETSSLRFSPDEMAARSTSFRSSSPPNIHDCSEASPSIGERTCPENKNKLKAILDDESLKEIVLSGSVFVNKTPKDPTTEEIIENLSFDPDSLECSGNTDTFMPENNLLLQNITCDQSFGCDLNFKDTSRFISMCEIEQNQFEISDSDFMTKDKALEIFKKDEEQLADEHKFENADNSKGSVFSCASENRVPPPSWFLDLHKDQLENSGRHISVGTLISARTENLGRLSEDSKRERPFFGTYVSTPVRGISESSSVWSESLGQTLELSNDQGIGSIENSTDFKNTTQGNEQSTLMSASNHESEILGRSALSHLLSEASTSQPLALADRILIAAKTKYGTENWCDVSSSIVNGEADKTLRNINNESQGLTVCTSNQEDFLPNLTSSSGVVSSTTIKDDEKDSKVCECANCLFRQQKLFWPGGRPASSCSNSCKNAAPFHNTLQGPFGCMVHSNLQEQCHQNLHPSCGTMQHLGNILLSSQFHNSCIPNPLPTRMLSIAIPQSVAQGPLSGISSSAFSTQGVIPHSFPAAQGQNDLCFPQKICVGDSQSITLTVQNTMHAMQYFYHISYVSASINEQPVSIEMAGIHFPSMFPRSMSSTTEIQITLNPKYEGKTVVILQIVACFNPSELTMAAIGNSSLKTKIQYESVRPSILISSHGKDNLNLGSVIAGSKVLEHISIINKCDAVVPLCLSLSNDLKDNCISFRINELKLQTLSTAAQWKVLSPKTIFFRLSNSNNEGTASPLEIPIIFEAGSDNCDLNFTLTAALQTATFNEPLGFLRISANVGRAELILTDSTKNRLLLCSETGSACSQNVTLKNQCSFPVVYDLMVDGNDCNSFSISPTSLNLEPLQCSAIKISFSPTSTLVVKGNLQAAAQPHGKVFSLIELIGTSKSTGAVPRSSRNFPPNVVSKSSSKDNKRVSYNSYGIECNKKSLSWGGVDIGNTDIKTFTIKNTSSKSLQVKLFIKEKSHTPFKIIDENKTFTMHFILGLVPKEQKSISVAFSPTRIAPSSDFLGVRPINIMEKDHKTFSIPLNGYGGTGKLKVAEVYEKEGIGNCLDIVVSSERRTVFSNLSVHNVGLRPIFVKVLSSGNSDKEQIVINPSEFILLENDSKTLIVSCTVENFTMINAADFGILTFLYGDEILRQQLKRSASENSNYQCTVCQGVNFDVPFVGEERVPYDPTYISKINIFSLFSSSLKKYLIHPNIIEQGANYTRMTFGPLSMLDNTYSSTMGNSMFRRVTAGPEYAYSPPVKDFTINALNRLSMPNSPTIYPNPCSLFAPKVDEHVAEKEDSSGHWTVKPELLTIDSTSKDNRILLINLSKQDLKFKIECAISVISVSPVSGIVSAKGQIGLRICLIPYSHGKLREDYKGYIKVICDGTEKSVLITVLKDQKKTKDSFNALESNRNFEQLQDMPLEVSTAEKTVIDSTSIFIKNICEFPKEIILNSTAPGKVSETTLVVQNPEKSSVEWDIHPFSMLFTQCIEDSLNVSNVLQVLPSSGVLQSKEKANIVVKFMPSNPDCFYRFFELTLNFSNGVKKTFNFKISGSSICLTENPELNKSSVVARSSIKRPRNDMYIENETCELPSTSVGKNSVSYVKVMNPSMQEYKLKIIKPYPPFIVQQSTVLVRPKKSIKIPVNFIPTKTAARDYEDVLILQSEIGHEFVIKLKGVCN